jgi:hypothetical protein
MSRLSKSDLLQSLRAQLQHFDQSPDFGDAEAVAAIRQHLVLRIREAEGALQNPVRARSDRELWPASHSEAA